MAPSAGVSWLRGWVSFGALAPRFANQGVLFPSGNAVSFGGGCFLRETFLTEFSGAWASTKSSNRQAPIGQPHNRPQQLPQHQQIAQIGKHHQVTRTKSHEGSHQRRRRASQIRACGCPCLHERQPSPGRARPCATMCSPCPTTHLGPVYSRANLHLN